MFKVMSGGKAGGTNAGLQTGRRKAGIKNSFVVSLALLAASVPTQPVFAMTTAERLMQQHMAEHKAVLDLVPVSAAKSVVANSGAWSNASTWVGGKLPVAGSSVYVPADKELLVDINSDTAYKTLRSDGVLSFATNQNVSLKLDTLVVTETGTFEIGSESKPVPADKKVEILIANNGPIDRDWDPANASRGVIIQGKTRIYGATKSAFHQLVAGPEKGTSQITLASAPEGWAVGDIVAVTATKFRSWLNRNNTQDELRQIAAISGNTITLGQIDNAQVADPFKYSHVPKISGMPVYVANFSRNIVISGEGGESVPPSQRGHFMVMHNPDTVIKGAGFYYLGRTDKSKPLNDYKLGSNGYRLKDETGQFIRDVNTNPRGRYSVHFHHTGTEASVAPVIFTGNAVFSSAGWGVVNHTSNVRVEDNASWNVTGSHYVSEDGNEIGTFKRNIAIRAIGRNSYIKFGRGNHDMGHGGHGFWLESRNLAMEDNVISGVNNSGVAYWHVNEMPGTDLIVKKENLLTPDKNLVKGKLSVAYTKIPITYEKGTTVLASFGALDVINPAPHQDHDVRSIFESFKAYSVANGVGIQYTTKYTFRNMVVIADPDTKPWFHGALFEPKVKDMVLVNSRINGFYHPVVTGTVFAGKPDNADMIFANTYVNDKPINLSKDIHTISNAVRLNYDSKQQRLASLPSSMMAPGALLDTKKLVFKAENPLITNFPNSYNIGYTFKGVKVDSFGNLPFESFWGYYNLQAIIKQGYYVDKAGKKWVILKDTIADRATGATREIVAKLKLNKYYKELGPNLGPLP
jgi:G8 domain